MQQALYLILGYLVGFHTANAAETFSFDMPQPRLRVVVPDIPQIKMGIHPNAALQPHARFMGTGPQGFNISILMPTADAGMSPRDCARTMHKSIMARFGVDPKFVVAQQANESTFVMLFPLKIDPLVQFKAFLLSGYAGSHCVEVHISKTIMPATPETVSAQLPNWYQGFRKAKIENY
jgi:hypothetical protein